MPMRDLRTLLMKKQVMIVIRNLDQEVTNPLRTMMTMRMMTMNWNYSENMLKLRRKERRNKEEKNSKKSRS